MFNVIKAKMCMLNISNRIYKIYNKFHMALEDAALQMGSTLKGKNLLLEEQILSWRRGPFLRREAKKGKIVRLLHLKE